MGIEIEISSDTLVRGILYFMTPAQLEKIYSGGGRWEDEKAREMTYLPPLYMPRLRK